MLDDPQAESQIVQGWCILNFAQDQGLPPSWALTRDSHTAGLAGMLALPHIVVGQLVHDSTCAGHKLQVGNAGHSVIIACRNLRAVGCE